MARNWRNLPPQDLEALQLARAQVLEHTSQGCCSSTRAALPLQVHAQRLELLLDISPSLLFSPLRLICNEVVPHLRLGRKFGLVLPCDLPRFEVRGC